MIARPSEAGEDGVLSDSQSKSEHLDHLLKFTQSGADMPRKPNCRLGRSQGRFDGDYELECNFSPQACASFRSAVLVVERSHFQPVGAAA